MLRPPHQRIDDHLRSNPATSARGGLADPKGPHALADLESLSGERSRGRCADLDRVPVLLSFGETLAPSRACIVARITLSRSERRAHVALVVISKEQVRYRPLPSV